MSKSNIQAIETEYKGWRMRSRLEARWAVYLDATGIRFDYEREGFELPSGWYLPDFWLPNEETWAEVKGQVFSETQIQLCRELALATHYNCLLLDGVPDLRTYNGWVWRQGQLQQGSAVVVQGLVWFDGPTFPLPAGLCSFYRLETFVHAARAARFEHRAVQPYNWAKP